MRKLIAIALLLGSSSLFADDCKRIDPEYFDETIKTMTMANNELLTIESYQCPINRHNYPFFYTTFHWKFTKNNKIIESGIYFDKNKEENSGIVGQSIERVSSSTIVIDESSERGGNLHLLHWSPNKTLISYKLSYTGHDEDGVCVSSKEDTINIQRCYWNFNVKKTRYYGDILKLKITNNTFKVMNPKLLKTFTDWDFLPDFKYQ